MLSESADLLDQAIYCVGIKGTGMTALVEILVARGARVSGSDVPDTFYTDQILKALSVPVFEGFEARNVPTDAKLIVYSAAYNPQTHVELVRARELGIPLLQYSQALGELSRSVDSSGIAGVHGKTSTTAMAGVLVQGLGLHGTVLTGSGVSNFDGRSVYFGGNNFFIAETCEYRRHFLDFSPSRIVVTSIEPDHLDYFRDYDDILQAFVEYGLKLPEGGTLIYCADDPGAAELAEVLSRRRRDLAMVPYGFDADGPFRITDHRALDGRQEFALALFSNRDPSPELRLLSLRVPGVHMVRNAAAALALVLSIYGDSYGDFSPTLIDALRTSLRSFRGTRRRSEVIGQAGGILVLDDYGHHPTAMETTIQGYRDFYPGRRIVLSFMSHTYSRTGALMDDFARACARADLVILHEIYASARETALPGVSGQQLAALTAKLNPQTHYFPDPEDAATEVLGLLQPGDIFLTMGAGDNWKLGRAVLAALEVRQ